MATKELENWAGRYVFVKGDPSVYHMTEGSSEETYLLKSCMFGDGKVKPISYGGIGNYHNTSFLKGGKFAKTVYPFWLQVDDEIELVKGKPNLVHKISCIYYKNIGEVEIIMHLEAKGGKIFTVPMTHLLSKIKFIKTNG